MAQWPTVTTVEVHNLDGGGQLSGVLDTTQAMTIDPGRRKPERDAMKTSDTMLNIRRFNIRRFICRYWHKFHAPVLRDDMGYVVPGQTHEIRDSEGVVVVRIEVNSHRIWWGKTVCRRCGCRLEVGGSEYSAREIMAEGGGGI